MCADGRLHFARDDQRHTEPKRRNMSGNPMPVVAGMLSYQVTGWCIGDRVFDSLNSEAMLFTFLAAGLALTGWLAWKQDEYSAAASFSGRAYWIAVFALGVGLGACVRFKCAL